MSGKLTGTWIAEGTTVTDLVPGKPDELEDLARKLAGYADDFTEAASGVRKLDTSSWQGQAAAAFRATVTQLPKNLDKAADAYRDAAAAIRTYQRVLVAAQATAKDVIEHDAPAARTASRSHQFAIDDYNDAVQRGDDSVVKPPENDPGRAAMARAVGRVNDATGDVGDAAKVAARKLKEATKDAPDKPNQFLAFAKGLGEGTVGLVEFLAKSNPMYVFVDPKGFVENAATQVDSLVWGAQNPVEFGKAAVDWDTWQNDPARALGHLVPNLALTAATKGTGSVGLRRMFGGKGRKNAGELPTPARKQKDRRGTKDPIDLATGEVFLPQADVHLPGQLPLVIERMHLSSYRAGGWFGPTWASTLDQRLEIDDEGAIYASPDGMLIAYPVPRPGEAVLPEKGPRWPMRWDGTPGGTVTITDPEQGRVLHFSLSAQPTNQEAPAAVLPLAAVENRNGHRITYTYDGYGALSGITHSGGYHIAVDTEADRITRLRLLGPDSPPEDHGIPLLTYGYDASGNLTEVTNSSGLPLRFTYDTHGRLTRWDDRNGSHYRYVYDHAGRCVRAMGSDDRLNATVTYDLASRVTALTDSLGETTTYHLNDDYQIVREVDPLGNSTVSEWDEHDRLLSRTDPLGRTTRYTYDTDGNLAAIARPDGSTATAAYNDLRLPVAITEPDGAQWLHEYDVRGNLLSITDPVGATTTHAYDEHGHLTSSTDALGNTSRVSSNPAGLPLAITDPLGATTRCRRDQFGRVTTLIDPVGGITRFGWTAESKLSWRTLPDGATERWTWDGEGNLKEHVNAAGHATSYEVTHFDLPSARTGPDGARHEFTYDTELRLTTVTNPQGLTWTYAYDPADRLVAETDFNGRTLAYGYDPAGQLISRTNGAGETIHYTRDLLGNITEQRTPDAVTTFVRDPAGRLLRATNADSDLVFERDPLGRVTAETCNGRTLASAYDALGRRIMRRTPTGAVSTWDWDAAGRPAALHTAGQTLAFTHDEAGRETSRHLGSDVTLTQTWDEAHRLTAQTLTTAAAQGTAPRSLHELATGAEPRILQQRAYTYQPDGHVTSINELTTGYRQYTLDPNGRVTIVTAANWTETYAYDTTGNLTRATTPYGDDTDGDRNVTGTLIHRAGRTRYEHDAQGRVTRTVRRLLSGATRTWTYTWNAEDRLTDVITPDGAHWHYTYDPFGRRTAKQHLANDGTILERVDFTWDGTRLAEQTATGGAKTWDYAPGTYRPVAQLDQDEVDTRFYAVITDLVGTPTELVDTHGEPAWQSRSTVWGVARHPTAADARCPLRFPGQYADPETGLNYNYQRYYDPGTSRYQSPDLLGLDPSPNHHTYVSNTQVLADPLGLAPYQPGILGNQPPGWHPSSIPSETLKAIKGIEDYGAMLYSKVDGVDGPQIPQAFANDGRSGGHRLPEFDSNGTPIKYTEWGTIQSGSNPRPGGERIVTGSDGSIYYTPTHYQTWIQYK